MSNGYRKPVENQGPKSWSSREAYLLAMVCLFVGVIAGYLLRGSSSPVAQPSAAAAPASSSAPPPQPLQSPEALNPVVQPMLDMLKVDPKNAETLIKLGNTYYDHKVYDESIKYYQRALEVRPDDVNVRTDMGTAYYYTGSPDRAIQEFEKSLKINPNHGQTLFNMGVVKFEGKKDGAGALAAWEKLLKTNPDYPEKQRVLDMMAQAKGQK